MKIVIAASHRFHLLDLARELVALGHDVKFYSYVPPWRCEHFGLSRKVCVWYWWIIPFFLLDKVFKGSKFPEKVRIFLMDSFLSKKMPQSDIFIALSGTYLKSFIAAKNKGAITFIERGSKHILEQKRILDNVPSLKGKVNVTSFSLNRELVGYDLADYISVATNHVEESFKLYGFEVNKIFKNPYGVDIRSFYPNNSIEKKYDVIMVGTWSYQKGCDLLLNVVERLGVSLLHVGSIGDLKFPDGPKLKHINAVDQNQLVGYYNTAKVFCLPSRQEGLAMVQLQAVACNLPIVCSKHSGGEDIKIAMNNSASVFVTEDETIEELERKLSEALLYQGENKKSLFYPFEGLSKFTWKSYGERYSSFLDKVMLENENIINRII